MLQYKIFDIITTPTIIIQFLCLETHGMMKLVIQIEERK
jgi:hypothetical protein